MAEKQLAASAATKDYFPKVVAFATYLHFNEDLGSVLATRDRSLGGATVGPGGIIQIPTVSVPGRTLSANVVNQDAAVGSVMVVQPITESFSLEGIALGTIVLLIGYHLLRVLSPAQMRAEAESEDLSVGGKPEPAADDPDARRSDE